MYCNSTSSNTSSNSSNIFLLEHLLIKHPIFMAEKIYISLHFDFAMYIQ